ncbi:MAG: hypothetical protein HGA53_04075, partial [Anaerolineaceae bacterium]|nr:hypothetical protein [Anaerolineaceae bacterium]
IGNEAVFSKVPAGKEPGLIGMDYLRLALERTKSAEEALAFITEFLQIYGQSGNCGYSHPFYYHNSFLIADPSQAWILETVGKYWIAEKVKSFGSISNAYTIRGAGDLIHPDLVNCALDMGLCKKKTDFDFATCFSDFLYTRFGAGRERQTCSYKELSSRNSHFDVIDAINLLRSHRHNNSEMELDGPITGASICMHAGFGPIRGSQSVGSMISHITPEISTYWVTGTSAPCTGLFKPVWLDTGLTGGNWTAGKEYSPESLWWRHEKLHRAIIQDYRKRIVKIQESQTAYDVKYCESAASAASFDERLEVSNKAFSEAAILELQWMEQIENIPVQRRNAFYYSMVWNGWNKTGSLPDPKKVTIDK